MTLKTKFFGIAFIAAGVVFAACAPKEVAVIEPTISAPLEAEIELIEPNLDEPQRHFIAGEYQEAIDGLQAVFEEHPQEATIMESYIVTLEEIKAAADLAFTDKDYSASERIYGVLLKNYYRFASFTEVLTFDENFLRWRIKGGRIARTEARSRIALGTADYTGSLDIIKSALRSYPGDEKLLSSLVATSAAIHQNGLAAQSAGDLVTAGRAYFALKQNYVLLEKSARSLPFSPESLEEGLKRCSTLLTRRGLQLYRRGELKQAIVAWEGILQFDPDNSEIKKAIANATVQLKKIKK